jgi:hypothetical protein
MSLSISLLRRFAPNISSRIGSYLGSARSNVASIFQRQMRHEPNLLTSASRPHFTYQAPVTKPTFPATRPTAFRDFSMGRDFEYRRPIQHSGQTRSFSTQTKPNIDMWRERIHAKPRTIDIGITKELTKDKLNALVSLVKNEGIFPARLVLPREGVSKDFIKNLLVAMKNWQPVLPGITVENKAASLHPNLSHIVYKADLSYAKKIEALINKETPEVWFYEMQGIPLKEDEVIDQFSDHIVNLCTNHDNVVFLTLKNESDLLLPFRIDPVTHKPDLTPRLLIPSDFFDKTVVTNSK